MSPLRPKYLHVLALGAALALSACTGSYRLGADGVLLRPDALAGLTVREAHNLGYKIPPGHYPPPGMCRVWYPRRPPGQQPPPVSCSAFVPFGAILIRG